MTEDVRGVADRRGATGAARAREADVEAEATSSGHGVARAERGVSAEAEVESDGESRAAVVVHASDGAASSDAATSDAVASGAVGADAVGAAQDEGLDRAHQFKQTLKVKTTELRAAYDRELQQLTRGLRKRRLAARAEPDAAVDAGRRRARCPAPAALLAARDGRGDPADDARVLLHVEACPHCSRFLWMTDEYLLGGDADLLSSSSPFLDVDVDADTHDLWLFEPDGCVGQASHAVRRWFPFASPVVAALLIAVLTLHTTSVTLRADALLERAILHEQVREDERAPARVRMRWMSNVVAFGREERPPADYGPIGDMRELASVATNDTGMHRTTRHDAAMHDRTAQLLAFHQFDLRHPLSVSRLQAWRANLSHKSDHLMLTGDLLTLRVTTPDGQLRMAEITFRAATLDVVGMGLVFDGLGRLEFLAAERPPTPPPLAPRQPLEAMRRPAPQPAEVAALQEAELDIRLLLRQHNLDLDGAVRIARVDDELRVTLPSTPAARALEPALEALSPRVRINWLGTGAAHGAASPGASSGVRIEEIASRETPSAEDTEMRPWVARWQERFFANVPDERAGFSVTLVERSRAAERHLVLLKALSARYSPREIDAMSPFAQQKLQRLVTWQHRALTQTLQQLSYRLATLGSSTLVTPHFACSPRISESSWRRVASRGPDRALTLRRSITRLVQTTTPALDANGQCDLTEIDRELVMLWDAVNGARVCGE